MAVLSWALVTLPRDLEAQLSSMRSEGFQVLLSPVTGALWTSGAATAVAMIAVRNVYAYMVDGVVRSKMS
jgi:pantothenate synthetase